MRALRIESYLNQKQRPSPQPSPGVPAREKRSGSGDSEILEISGSSCSRNDRCPLAPADVLPGWGGWWLPPNHAVHGVALDLLFDWIFWITAVVFVVVHVLLVWFLIRYRRQKNKTKAHFTHGNTRLEMAWTIVPAIILAVLALASKRVWDNYRYADEDPNRATILVIGQQFKWNVIYPGPDGKLGRYLIFPRPTDLEWGDPNYFTKQDAIANALKRTRQNPRPNLGRIISTASKAPLFCHTKLPSKRSTSTSIRLIRSAKILLIPMAAMMIGKMPWRARSISPRAGRWRSSFPAKT